MQVFYVIFGSSEGFIYLCINMLTPLPVEQRAQGEPFYLYYGQNRKIQSETSIYRGTNCISKK